MKFIENARKHAWPYLILGIGLSLTIALSVAFWIDLKDNYIDILTPIKHYLPEIILTIGATLSLLLAYATLNSQLAKERAITLNKTNEELKREIHERTQTEEAKQSLEFALLQGQKLQAMGTLAGGIAHDFNNILYAIVGYVEMAREDVPKDNLTHTNLGKVLDACKRGQELVARILTFSRRQQHNFERTSLVQIIDAALGLLTAAIPASVSINFDKKVDTFILGNHTQLQQVFVNLINNAVDAMDGEGAITITMSEVSEDDALFKQLTSLRNTSKKYTKIEVSDSGHGMDQATMDRIFEPFYTTKEVGKGTGLGLSIVHSVIKEHGGEVTVQSQLGKGTTFIILLPEFNEIQVG